MHGGKRAGGGRKKGVPNKLTAQARDALGPLIGKARETAEQILSLTLACSVCRGKGKTEFQPKGDNAAPGIRRCQSCWGSGKEQISPELRARIAIDVLDYGHPRLKAIEHTGKDGGAILVSVGERIRAKHKELRESTGHA